MYFTSCCQPYWSRLVFVGVNGFIQKSSEYPKFLAGQVSQDWILSNLIYPFKTLLMAVNLFFSSCCGSGQSRFISFDFDRSAQNTSKANDFLAGQVSPDSFLLT